MIVRIMADNQYRIVDGYSAEIEQLDNELMEAIEAGDEARFHATLHHLIEHVHQSGKVVPDAELVPSDMMVPAEDMTLAEAQAVLQKTTVPESGGATEA
jgi:hypothetical protein